MRLKGRTTTTPATTRDITVRDVNGEPLSFTITRLPADYNEVQQDLLPEPQPPRAIARTGSKAIVRDPKTQTPVLVEDVHDADYQQVLGRIYRARLAMTMATALALDPNVEWEAPRPDDLDAHDPVRRRQAALSYFVTLSEELHAAGLGPIQQVQVLRAIAEFSGTMASEQEALAAGAFSGRA